jgi:GTPase SAR1 family protein
MWITKDMYKEHGAAIIHRQLFNLNCKSVKHNYREIMESTSHVRMESEKQNVSTKVIRVLVVGTTQSGKSSFISYAHKYENHFANKTEELTSLKVGTGDVSITSQVTTYPMTIQPIHYSIQEESKQYFLSNETSVDNIIQLVRQEKMCLRDSPEPIAETEPMRIEFIDTPGLDESKEQDEQHILDIIEVIQAFQEITAVCFVVSANQPLSSSFLQFFKYYRTMVPELGNNLFVVHTKWGLRERYEESNKIRERNLLFLERTEHKCAHFYINTVPDDILNPTLEAYDNAISCSTMTSILQYLIAKDNVKIDAVRYHKSNNIKRLEAKIDVYCKSLISGYTDGVAIMDREAGVLIQKIAECNSYIVTHETTLNQMWTRLTKINRDGFIMVGIDTEESSTISLFDPKKTKEYIISNKYPIAKVRKTNISKGTWGEEIYSNDRRTVSCVFTAGLWSPVTGVMTAFGTLTDFYKKEIHDIKKNFMLLKAEVLKIKESLNDLNGAHRTVIANGEEQKQYLENISALLGVIHQEYYPVEVFLKLRPIYKELQHADCDTSNMVKQFVKLTMNKQIE